MYLSVYFICLPNQVTWVVPCAELWTAAPARHFPREVLPAQGSHTIRIASSAHTPMQCSSLPHASGRVRTASAVGIPRQAGPQALTQSPQPEHLSSSMTVGGRILGTEFWRRFAALDCVVA